MLVSVMVHAFCFQVPFLMPYSPMGAQPLGFALLQPFRVYPWQAYVHPGDGNWPRPWMHWVGAPFTALSRRSLMLLSQLFSCHPSNIMGHKALVAWQRVTWSLCLPYMVGRGLLFQDWLCPITWSNSESVVGNQSDDSGMVVGYQVDEVTHIWSTEQFVAHAHTYP